MTHREMERLLDLLSQASEELDLDGKARDNIGQLRSDLWDLLENNDE